MRERILTGNPVSLLSARSPPFSYKLCLYSHLQHIEVYACLYIRRNPAVVSQGYFFLQFIHYRPMPNMVTIPGILLLL